MNEANYPPAKILVVDDKPTNLDILFKRLQKAGLKVLVAASGKGALRQAERTQPDLILLDIMMPNMDGIETCRRLKQNEATQKIPIIFMTALTDVQSKVLGFNAGAVDYVTKPIELEEVVARVNIHLTIRNLHLNLQKQNELLKAENSRRKQAEESLQKAFNQLAQRTAELDAFAHTVAHDLKNPLNAMAGYIHFLKEDLAGIDVSGPLDLVNRIESIGKKMSNIVAELLLLASVRKGEVQTEPLDMANIVAQSTKRLESMIEEYGGEIVLPADWPTAKGYAPWLEEVWVNYISNGLKYSGDPPRLEFGATPQDDDMIRFWVKDNGQGLTPEEQALLFTEFTRLGEIRAQGHGLGLSIVRRIVDKLGGQAGVESEVGQGCTFYFTLPQ